MKHMSIDSLRRLPSAGVRTLRGALNARASEPTTVALETNAGVNPDYDKVFRTFRVNAGVLGMQRGIRFDAMPAFSIVIAMRDNAAGHLEDTVESVRCQSYAQWEIISAETTSEALASCTGDYICLLEAGDVLEPDALFEFARAINQHPNAELLYCDEDKVDASGSHYSSPAFKPDFDIDLLRSTNYIGHFPCVGKSVLAELPDLPLWNHGSMYDLVLRVVERVGEVRHIQKVLYHERILGDAPDLEAADAADRQALVAHLQRVGVPARVEPGPAPCTFHVSYEVQDDPLVSIIIPNKDGANLLTTCVESLLSKTTYGRYEIIIVDNNSEEPDTPACYDRLQKLDPRISVVTWPAEFNFSKIVNFGAEHARGEFLLLLNNDTEVISPVWLENMLGLCQQEGVGAVGAKLLYPDDTVQHAGIVVVDEFTTAHHSYRGLPDSNTGYRHRAALTGQCVAVTGACLMVERSTFQQVGGFSEDFAVAFNDVDFCFKLRDAGYRVVYEPTAKLYHYESVTRGYDDVNIEKQTRVMSEGMQLIGRWAQLYIDGDPFFSPFLSSYCSHLKYEWERFYLL